MALPRTVKELQFASGLNTKGDDRAQPEQLLAIGKNVEFDDVGGLRCRFPFDAVRTAIVGGGTLSNARRLAMNGDELLCFTKDSLYSWSAAESGWVWKATHLAVMPDEDDVFAAATDQYDPDRAELGGVEFFTWVDLSGTWIAARDKVTGTMIASPTLVGQAFTRPRLVALTTKVLFFFVANVDTIFVASLNPADPVGSINGGVFSLVTNVFGGVAQGTNYDVVRLGQTDSAAMVMQHTGFASYDVALVTAALVLTKTNKVRACNGAIAIAASPDAAYLQIVRSNPAGADFNGTGDLLDAVTLADVFTGTNFAAPPVATEAGFATANQQIACAYRDVQDGGHYRCYVWFSASPATYSMWVDTANNTGGLSAGPVYDVTIKHVSLASRAFAFDGHVYVWTVFDQASSFPGANAAIYTAQLQNTYFLYRDDGRMCSSAADASCGGAPPTVSHLPGVGSIGGNAFAWCGTRMRRVLIGVAPQIGYNNERTPRDIVVTFDDDRARRCVRLGRTLYITGGEIYQYDGAGIYEVGFHVYPWHFGLADDATAGNIAAGTYAYKMTWRWANAQSETERSTTATVAEIVVAGANHRVSYSTADHLYGLCQTHKLAPQPIAELWRTALNPTAASPFYLASAAAVGTTGPNGYLRCNPPADALVRGFGVGPTQDNFSDATLTTKASNPETGPVLPNLVPPPASIIAKSTDRLFLAGVPGLPNRVWYSRLRGDGEIASFNDALTFDTPSDGGAITAVDYLDGALIVWCETATYAFAGAGFDNNGGGTNFQLSRVLSKDLGCISAETCALFDGGFLVKTNKGWFVLDRALSYQDNYVGAGVFKYDAENVVAMTVLTARHQVRILSYAPPFIPPPALIEGILVTPPPIPGNCRMLVFDTLVKQWAETSVNDGLDMLLWNGTPAYLTATGVRAELATWDGYAGADYSLTEMDIETGWIKFGEMQPRAVVDFVQLLGQLDSACVIRKRLAKDYEAVSPGVWNYHTDFTWTPFPATLGSALQVRQAPRWKPCEALKARFTITAADGVSPLGGPCAHLTSLAIQFALETNAYSALAAAQKQ